eukprot:TRINITY_DN8223_c0_g1_i1.p1 TRINITY_DN8223_c0_g1~~TRINITY_DN8223_c0_g1_i1.p1  ORF type:complete len:597 (-),score=156.65 TRINITY_DN8223_c0_g1_i1:23-1609(-)
MSQVRTKIQQCDQQLKRLGAGVNPFSAPASPGGPPPPPGDPPVPPAPPAPGAPPAPPAPGAPPAPKAPPPPGGIPPAPGAPPPAPPAPPGGGPPAPPPPSPPPPKTPPVPPSPGGLPPAPPGASPAPPGGAPSASLPPGGAPKAPSLPGGIPAPPNPPGAPSPAGAPPPPGAGKPPPPSVPPPGGKPPPPSVPPPAGARPSAPPPPEDDDDFPSTPGLPPPPPSSGGLKPPPPKITVSSVPVDEEEIDELLQDKRRSTTLSSAPAVVNLSQSEKAGPTARMSRRIEVKRDTNEYKSNRDYTSEMKKYQGKYSLDSMSDLRKKDNFAKKTYFKKKADLKDQMYVFQREPIPRSLIKYTKADFAETPEGVEKWKDIREQGKQLFRSLLNYLGVNFHQYPATCAAEIISIGVKEPLLRDEIFVQLVKQTTQNDDEVMCIKAYKLMFLCLRLFPPDRESVHMVIRSHLAAKAVRGMTRFVGFSSVAGATAHCWEALDFAVQGVLFTKEVSLEVIEEFVVRCWLLWSWLKTMI